MTHGVTFRCYWSAGIEDLIVELAEPVRFTRLQHKRAPGGLSEFKPNHDFTVWTQDYRAGWARFGLSPFTQSDAQMVNAVAAAVLQFAARTGMRPCRRGNTVGLESDIRKAGLPISLESAWRHPISKKYFLVGRPVCLEVPRVVAFGFDMERLDDKFIFSRKLKKPDILHHRSLESPAVPAGASTQDI